MKRFFSSLLLFIMACCNVIAEDADIEKEYMKPSVLVVLLKSQGNLLSGTIYTYPEADDPTTPEVEEEDEEIEIYNPWEIL